MTQQNQRDTRSVSENSSGSMASIPFHGIRSRIASLRTLRLMLVALIAFATLIPQAEAQSTDIGMTPSHVAGLWTNINRALITAARLSGNDTGLVRDLEAMQPNSFSGKNPKDVLGKVTEVRAKLDQFRAKSELMRTEVYGNGDGTVNPTIVFLNSGLEIGRAHV